MTVTAGTGAEEQQGEQAPVRLTYRWLFAALPGKPEACFRLTLPISFQFTKAFLESWLHTGGLNKHDNPHQLVT